MVGMPKKTQNRQGVIVMDEKVLLLKETRDRSVLISGDSVRVIGELVS